MKQCDIDRALILIYESSNHAMWVNYTKVITRIESMPEKGKKELVDILRILADEIEEETAVKHKAPLTEGSWLGRMFRRRVPNKPSRPPPPPSDEDAIGEKGF